jgi:hypothetical protein
MTSGGGFVAVVFLSAAQKLDDVKLVGFRFPDVGSSEEGCLLERAFREAGSSGVVDLWSFGDRKFFDVAKGKAGELLHGGLGRD